MHTTHKQQKMWWLSDADNEVSDWQYLEVPEDHNKG